MVKFGATSSVCGKQVFLESFQVVNFAATAEANTRSFLQDMFYLCIGNAFLYFLVSLIASISTSAGIGLL